MIGDVLGSIGSADCRQQDTKERTKTGQAAHRSPSWNDTHRTAVGSRPLPDTMTAGERGRIGSKSRRNCSRNGKKPAAKTLHFACGGKLAAAAHTQIIVSATLARRSDVVYFLAAALAAAFGFAAFAGAAFAFGLLAAFTAGLADFAAIAFAGLAAAFAGLAFAFAAPFAFAGFAAVFAFAAFFAVGLAVFAAGAAFLAAGFDSLATLAMEPPKGIQPSKRCSRTSQSVKTSFAQIVLVRLALVLPPVMLGQGFMSVLVFGRSRLLTWPGQRENHYCIEITAISAILRVSAWDRRPGGNGCMESKSCQIVAAAGATDEPQFFSSNFIERAARGVENRPWNRENAATRANRPRRHRHRDHP
jgi:hypothetical protein